MNEKEPYINKFRAVPANRLEWARLRTIKERYGDNVLRIPSNISGNKDDLIVFTDSNGLRHCRIFGAGKNNTFKALHLLGWNDRHQNWGDEYIVSTLESSAFFPSRVVEKDRTMRLYKWLNEVMFGKNCKGNMSGFHHWYRAKWTQEDVELHKEEGEES